MGNVRLAAAGQVIHDTHTESARQQKIDHVAADEPGATGNNGDTIAHAAFRFFMRRTL
jgi:hypothetical protein